MKEILLGFQYFRAVNILLNCYKGKFSENPKITNQKIYKILKVDARTINRVKIHRRRI